VKIGELASRRRRGGLSPIKARVFQYLQEHPDEVFPYRDERLARQLSIKVSAFSFTLWALHRDGLIDRQEVDGKVYFGSPKAVANLRAKLGIAQPQEPFGRARANLERIRARVGNVNTLELLDAVRGPWE
jgi:hypothetical protein